VSEPEAFIHPSAIVEPGAVVGSGSRVWHHCHLRSGATIGHNCVLGMNVFVDAGVVIGDAVKIQNNVSVYRGVELAAGVFVGPSVVFTNDVRPRAQKPDWQVSPTVVGCGASVGANATVVAGVEIGEHAMVGAGAVVTRTVRAHQLVAGNPARHHGWVCRCGEVVSRHTRHPGDLRCTRCQETAHGERSTPQRRIPLAVVQTGAAEQEAVLGVLLSGNLAGGAQVTELEHAFADAHGAGHAVAVSNGTAALVAALRAHGIGPGHEVITSPLTFVATLNAILEVGATARFAEISEDLTVDPDSVATLVTARTRALLPVHLYGLPADMEPVNAIASRHGLAVIQDAAQAHAAQLGPDPIGRFSTATFSFYATKNITCGEGGMVTTNDERIAERLRLLRNHGMRTRYDYALPGYNYRLTDLQAAIATVQLSRLPEFTQRRAHNAARLSAGLAGLSGLILPAVPDGRRHVWHQYTVQVTVDARMDRDQLAKFLDAAQIEARPYYPRLVHDYPCYRDHPQVIADETLRARRAAEEVLSLPVHPALRDHDIDRIIAQVRDALGDEPSISASLGGGIAADG
jgi:dTDP-4-amino-4,6-dideoxygalactose transaminase/acetyltransferase-like isoleucine patch superfamily enzyme